MESYKNQPLLRQVFKEPPIISFKKGKSLKDMLVRAKITPRIFSCFLFSPPLYSSFFALVRTFLDELTRKRYTG